MPESRGLKLLEKKLDYLGEIMQLTQMEKRIIDNKGEIDILKMEDILGQKQSYMKKIDSMDEEYASLCPKKTDEIKRAELDIKELLRDIVAIDREKKGLMEARFSVLKRDLKGVRQGIRANRAYGYEEQNNILIDEKK